MIKYLLSDTAVRKIVTGVDSYDNPVISDIKTFPCRVEFSDNIEVSSDKAEITSPVKIICEEKIGVGDLITYNYVNYKVIQVIERADLSGVVRFYEVFVV